MIGGFPEFAEYLGDNKCTWLLMELHVEKAGPAKSSTSWGIEVVAENPEGVVGDWSATNTDIRICFADIIKAMKEDQL